MGSLPNATVENGTKFPELQDKRPILAARLKGPGPGRYNLPTTLGTERHDPTKRHAPAIKHGTKQPDIWEQFRYKGSPGPKYGFDPKVTNTGRHEAPYFSLKSRPPPEPAMGLDSPSPGRYNPLFSSFKGGRTCSLKGKTKQRSVDKVPPPNSYRLPPIIGPKRPHLVMIPGRTMNSRSKIGNFAEDLSETPGPGAYSKVNPDVTQRKGAMFSMASRPPWKDPLGAGEPGPGDFNTAKFNSNKPAAPKFTMGIRHSELIYPNHHLL